MEVLAIDDSHIGKRSEPRISMFVAARLNAETVSGSVRIRNLSSRGGLIENDRLPDVGERIELLRGEFFAAGKVIWKNADRAGLLFDQPIAVSEWLPTGHGGQQTVDTAFQQIKTGADFPTLVGAGARTVQPVDAAQMLQAAEALEALADQLAEDIEAIARIGASLQVLDFAPQLLRRLAALA